MAMLGDGKTHYDHDFDGNASELGGCAAEFRNKAGSTTVRVTNIQNKYLKLEYKNPDSQNFISCFTISVSLPERKYLGFSAMTGGVSSEHAIQKIRAWNVLKVSILNDRAKKLETSMCRIRISKRHTPNLLGLRKRDGDSSLGFLSSCSLQ
jgi:hypothetical protein